MRRGLNLTRGGSLSVRLVWWIHPNGARKRFALSSRNFETTRYEATVVVVRRFQPARLFRECQILGGCKADFALRRSSVERRHNNDNYYYKFVQDVRASPKFDVNAAPCGINVGLVFSRLDSLRFALATIRAKIFRFSELIRTTSFHDEFSLSDVH